MLTPNATDLLMRSVTEAILLYFPDAFDDHGAADSQHTAPMVV